jgi:hypothetical protein
LGARPTPSSSSSTTTRSLRPSRCAKRDRARAAVALDARDLAAVHHADPLGREARLDDPRRVLVLARQDVRVGVQHGDLAAEPAERLRELAADRPAPITPSRRGRSVRLKIVSLVR